MRHDLRRIPTLIAPFALLAYPTGARADVIWPAAIYVLEADMYWWMVLLGFALEWPFFRAAVGGNYTRRFMALLASNAVSTLAGIPLIPALGLLPEFIPFFHTRGNPARNPVTWLTTFVIAVALNTAIEYAVVRRFAACKSRRTWLLLLGANALSVGVFVGAIFAFEYSIKVQPHPLVPIPSF